MHFIKNIALHARMHSSHLFKANDVEKEGLRIVLSAVTLKPPCSVVNSEVRFSTPVCLAKFTSFAIMPKFALGDVPLEHRPSVW